MNEDSNARILYTTVSDQNLLISKGTENKKIHPDNRLRDRTAPPDIESGAECL